VILIGLICVAISGAAEALMDTLQFHYDRSFFTKLKNQNFWRPDLSWKNKWKGEDPQLGERFLGSSTLFVGLTDGWHLFKLVHNLFLFIGLLIVSISLYLPLHIAISFVVARVIFGVSFTLVFKYSKV
jgi:hypothetical protein